MLLMRVLIMEFNNLLFPARFPTRWGLKDAFIALRRVELKTWSDPPNDFQVSRTSRVRHEVAAAEVESRDLCQAAHSAASVTVELPARLREAAHCTVAVLTTDGGAGFVLPCHSCGVRHVGVLGLQGCGFRLPVGVSVHPQELPLLDAAGQAQAHAGAI